MTKPGKNGLVSLAGKEQVYSVRKSRKAKRLLLHVDVSGKIELVLPYWVSYKQGHAFVQSKQAWIKDRLEEQSVRARSIPKYRFVTGDRIVCFGEAFELKVVSVKSARTTIKQQGNILNIRGSDPQRAITRWYKKQAELFFTAEVAQLSESIQVQDVAVRINNARSQWGSCNPKKKSISFTWRLALAPPEIARYVIAHEVAHLRHGGHDKKFWQLVAELHPMYQHHRQYLKEKGHTLTL